MCAAMCAALCVVCAALCVVCASLCVVCAALCVVHRIATKYTPRLKLQKLVFLSE